MTKTKLNLFVSQHRGFTVGERGEGKVLGVLPFYHIYGMVVSQWCALHAGNTVVTLPRFQPQHFLSAIQTRQVSLTQNLLRNLFFYWANSTDSFNFLMQIP